VTAADRLLLEGYGPLLDRMAKAERLLAIVNAELEEAQRIVDGIAALTTTQR
jgi:hypothetical protein